MRSRPVTILLWAMLLVVMGWRLQDFLDLGMTTNDQLVFSTDLVGRGVWEVTLERARQHGRIYYLLTQPVDLLLATYATKSIVQVAILVLFAAVPCMVAWMAFRERDEQLVFLLGYWTLCAVGWFSTTPAAYPILPTLPLAFAWLAAVFGHRYLRMGGLFGILAFGLSAFVAFFQYEPGALIAGALLLWFIHTRAPASPGKRALYAATAVSLGLYVAFYVTWRWIYPTAYEGGTLGELSPGAVGRVLAAHAIGALPLTNLLGGMPPVTVGDAMIGRQVWPYPPVSPGSLMRGIEWMDVPVSMAGAAMLWFVATERRNSITGTPPHSATLARQLCLGALILLLSSMLLALTAKYQLWARGWRPYLTSYYALFGWAIIVTGISVRMVRRGHAAILILSFVAIFLYSSAYNHIAARYIRANFSKWQAVGALAACADQLKQYQGFVMPAAFSGVSERASNWSIYWRDWTSRSFGAALRISADADGIGAGSIAFVHPELSDHGQLKAVVGRGNAQGFVIYDNRPPNFAFLRSQSDGNNVSSGTLVAVDGRERLRCRNGYRMVVFTAERPIAAVDVFWHLPGVIVNPPAGSRLFVVSDQDAERAVQALYLGFFKRPADPGGLQFWVERVRRAGGTLRDVAEGFSAASERDAEPLAGDFSARLAQSYQRLVGRPPRLEEIDRLSGVRDRPELVALLPWLVAADLLKAGDARFANRLEVAQSYTRDAYPLVGWQAGVWEQALGTVGESPESVQRAITMIRK